MAIASARAASSTLSSTNAGKSTRAKIWPNTASSHLFFVNPGRFATGQFLNVIMPISRDRIQFNSGRYIVTHKPGQFMQWALAQKHSSALRLPSVADDAIAKYRGAAWRPQGQYE